MDNTMGKNQDKSPTYMPGSIQKNEAEFMQCIVQRLGLETRLQNKDLQKILMKACDTFHCKPEEYLEGLKRCEDNSPFLEFIVAQITIGETYFFRDKHQMRVLEDVILPRIIQKKREENNLSLRIWSAGCSSGEEIYTLAIMLQELLPDLRRWSIRLLGTDINTRLLQKARLGVYSKWSMRSISKDCLERYFTIENNHYLLASDIRHRVEFQYLNLNDNSYPSILNNTNSQDLILCRNVMIYFNPINVGLLMKKLCNSLNEGAYLLLGASDPVIINGCPLVHHHQEGMVFSRKESKAEQKKVPPASMKSQLSILAPRLKKDSIVLTDVGNTQEEIPLLNQAIDYANKGKLEQALQCALKCMEEDPTNKDCYFILAMIFIEQNKLEEAETALRKTLYLDRKSVEGHFQLGLLLLKTKRKKEGLKYLQNALSIVIRNESTESVPNSPGLSYGRFAEILRAEIGLYTKAGEQENEKK